MAELSISSISRVSIYDYLKDDYMISRRAGKGVSPSDTKESHKFIQYECIVN